MDESRVAEIVNKLVDMLVDTGIDSFEIYDSLSLGTYEAGYLGLSWLNRMYENEEEDEDDEV